MYLIGWEMIYLRGYCIRSLDYASLAYNRAILDMSDIFFISFIEKKDFRSSLGTKHFGCKLASDFYLYQWCGKIPHLYQGSHTFSYTFFQDFSRPKLRCSRTVICRKKCCRSLYDLLSLHIQLQFSLCFSKFSMVFQDIFLFFFFQDFFRPGNLFFPGFPGAWKPCIPNTSRESISCMITCGDNGQSLH